MVEASWVPTLEEHCPWRRLPTSPCAMIFGPAQVAKAKTRLRGDNDIVSCSGLSFFPLYQSRKKDRICKRSEMPTRQYERRLERCLCDGKCAKKCERDHTFHASFVNEVFSHGLILKKDDVINTI